MSLAELAAIKARMAANPILGNSIAEMRAGIDAMGNNTPMPEGVAAVPADDVGVPAEWLVPEHVGPGRVILYLHGGGYVIGSIASHRSWVSLLAREASARALIIDYRLAPEHPHPAAVEDALAAYRFLLGRGHASGTIVVAGDSAGGGLTMATLLAIRDAGLPQPAGGFCVSPWVDLEGIGESMTGKAAEDPMVQKPGLLAMAKDYLNGADPRTPLAAPLYADLAGLAPLLIQVGAAETLLDDSTRLAARAGAAHVDVQLEIWPHMIHVWHALFPGLSEARDAIAKAGAWINARTR